MGGDGRQCVSCGIDLIGRQRKWCAKCNPDRSNRVRIAAAARGRGEAELADELLRSKQSDDIDPAVTAAIAPALFAAGLSLTSNAPAAAALVGLGELDRKELRKLERAARKDFAALIEGNASAIASVGFSALTIGLLRTIEGLTALAPQSRASSTKAVVDALEKLTVAAKPTFGDIEVVFEEKDDDE